MSHGPCEVALGWPCGGMNGASVRTSCYKCGRQVCGTCSSMVTLRRKRVRLCADRVDEEAKNITRLAAASGASR
jgi:hypothetical protein